MTNQTPPSKRARRLFVLMAAPALLVAGCLELDELKQQYGITDTPATACVEDFVLCYADGGDAAACDPLLAACLAEVTPVDGATDGATADGPDGEGPDGDRPPRPDGDRPDGDRPPRPDGDRPEPSGECGDAIAECVDDGTAPDLCVGAFEACERDGRPHHAGPGHGDGPDGEHADGECREDLDLCLEGEPEDPRDCFEGLHECMGGGPRPDGERDHRRPPLPPECREEADACMADALDEDDAEDCRELVDECLEDLGIDLGDRPDRERPPLPPLCREEADACMDAAETDEDHEACRELVHACLEELGVDPDDRPEPPPGEFN